VLAGLATAVAGNRLNPIGALRGRCVNQVNESNKRRNAMGWQLTGVLMSVALAGMSGAALAHHSFAMFDDEHPIDLDGIVQEFKYTNPHSYLLLEVKRADGSIAVWNLEGGAPSLLTRDGWSSKSLKPGDHVVVTINPLRSGAPGGSWNLRLIKFKDGRPIVVTP
jgi:hypothetical protein